jgi:hypothetical protein
VQCYFYRHNPDWWDGTLWPSPDDETREKWEREDANAAELKVQQDPENRIANEAWITKMLKDGVRTPRSGKELIQWHRPTVGKELNNKGPLQRLAFGNEPKRSRRVPFGDGSGRDAPQGLKLLTARMQIRTYNAAERGSVRKNEVEPDVKVIMVDIGKDLQDAGHTLFDRLLPAFENAGQRKVQVHVLKGGRDKYDPALSAPRGDEGDDDLGLPPLTAAGDEGGEGGGDEGGDGGSSSKAAAAAGDEGDEGDGGSSSKAAAAAGSSNPSRTPKKSKKSKKGQNRDDQERETLYEMLWRKMGMNPKEAPGQPIQLARGVPGAASAAGQWALLRRQTSSDKELVWTTDVANFEGERLSADEVVPEKIQVVTFATVQSMAPHSWTEFVDARDVTVDTLGYYNRWVNGARGEEGVPAFWTLANIERYASINEPGGQWSPGVNYLWSQQPDESRGEPILGGLMKPVRGDRDEWLEVDREVLDDFALRSVLPYVSNFDPHQVKQLRTGVRLDQYPHIGPLTAGSRKNKHDHAVVIPYALYRKSDYDAAAQANADEQERLQRRSAWLQKRADEHQKKEQKAQGAVDAAQEAADAAAAKAAAKAEAERLQESSAANEDAQRTLDRNLVREFRDANMVEALCSNATYKGEPIRNQTDRTWWELYKKCEVDAKPIRGLRDESNEFLRSDVRREDEELFKKRRRQWRNEPEEMLKLPWEPSQHEASYKVYAAVAGVTSQQNCVDLVGDRPEESSKEFQTRQEVYTSEGSKWRTPRKKCEEAKAKAKAAAKAKAEEEAKAAAAAAKAKAEEEAKAAAAAAKAKADEEAAAATREALYGSDSDDDMPDAVPDAALDDADSSDLEPPPKRVRPTDEILADDVAPDAELELALDTPPGAEDGVQWLMLGGIGVGLQGSAQTLRLTVASASQERFQEAWRDATRDERIALVAMRAEGRRLLAEAA